MTNKAPNYYALYIENSRLVRKPELEQLLGIKRTTLWRWIKSGKFPKPTLVQSGRSYWRFEDIHNWLAKS
ncbi:AlpA family phage regulatory protein [Shewanella sp. C32]|uniref:AlpA family phage regulatory protein n=1 Tax=Shewanella electrica TaxID=515560 RepID=A0ABT2FQB0_9GAMM|nr:AlpA family phage regulatory protein [Shewanella electrica]MCH1926394.1 AlpA family phage regulatory protein [Shewanella electrica]MCS4557835.1 AlpA family phage regulatory protein [Shewanella electrica]